MATKLKCPDCEFFATDPRHLGRHRRFTHGTPGKKNFRKDGTPRKGATLPPGMTPALIKCTEPDCIAEFPTSTGLAIHKKFAHGIPGKTAKYNKVKKANKTALVKVEPAAIETNGNGHHRGRAATQSPNGFPLQFIGHVVGYLERCCHEEAFKNDLPAKTFTRDVAEFFLAKMTIGQ